MLGNELPTHMQKISSGGQETENLFGVALPLALAAHNGCKLKTEIMSLKVLFLCDINNISGGITTYRSKCMTFMRAHIIFIWCWSWSLEENCLIGERSNYVTIGVY